ncbi:hypothetical protein GMORB2_3130 [Geosmithia morbida]|uniref:Uncharacterized protein n=1 Tax=Geosmithia morbida TaxID=1094350 RepID=A0A9P4YSS0_9HYPO|nr:uncharacterized protein GMORB2_3130 [Geosmithia morbida]KAF4120329.1 hypothetical protein GMORB2_3130 [Geosmithia morbida]
MRFSIASVAIFPAALVAAFDEYAGTFHSTTGCHDTTPHFVKGAAHTDCTILNETANSLSAYENRPRGYCHISLYSDTACVDELEPYADLVGTCQDVAGIKSFKTDCYR